MDDNLTAPSFSQLGDERGTAVTEFGLLAPVMALMLVGALDIGHTLYMHTVLQGAVQKAARDTGLEAGLAGSNRTAIDNRVKSQVKRLHGSASVAFTRRFYRTFSEATAKNPEEWTDTNSNAKCDNGEPYVDRNNNSTYDRDGGDEGQGGAKDAVLYTVTVSYPRMFPLHSFLNISPTTVVKAQTVLANQPYGDQGSYAAPTTRNCTT